MTACIFKRSSPTAGLTATIAALVLAGALAAPAAAEPRGARFERAFDNDDGHPGKGHGNAWGRRAKAGVVAVDYRGPHGHWRSRHYSRPIISGTVIYVEPRHVRRYRNVVVIRPFGHRYHGYGHYRRDAEAWRYLAFTAITLGILNNMNERQQRSYEQAQVTAASAPIGQTITWNDSGAFGSVTPLRDGTSSSGAYCREFRQTVTIGGRTEDAFGTACRKPDGAWEVVSAGQ